MKKWLNWIALVLVFSVACGFLSNWQFNRRQTKLASIDLVKRNYDAPIVDFDLLVNAGKLKLPQTQWRPVTISGHFIPEKFLLVRDRPNDGSPGFEELVPFDSNGFGIIYVTRGWLPSGNDHDYPDSVPLPSSNPTTLTARIVQAEPIMNRGAPKGQIATINIKLANFATDLHSKFTNGYLREISESPATGKLAIPMAGPATEEGNNLSYAMQWILFAVMAVGALVWRIRKDNQEAAGIVRKRRRLKSDIDAEIEDEIMKAK